MTGRQAHRTATYLLSLVMAALGVGLIVQALSGAGAISPRMILGVLFIAAGTGRVYLEKRRGGGG